MSTEHDVTVHRFEASLFPVNAYLVETGTGIVVVASLCQALAGSGVTVNAIAAGLIRTPEVEQWFYSEAEARGWSDRWDEIEANIFKSYLSIPVGHIGTADDVDRVAVFLASPRAEFVNGAVVRVDGGSHTWAG
jgi:3-oxoacyl-[acyl-carrier protein] reductase